MHTKSNKQAFCFTHCILEGWNLTRRKFLFINYERRTDGFPVEKVYSFDVKYQVADPKVLVINE